MWDPVHANKLGLEGRIAEINTLIAQEFGDTIEIVSDKNQQHQVPQWHAEPSRSRIIAGERRGRRFVGSIHRRLYEIIPLIAHYQNAGGRAGSVGINLADIGEEPGLAFCDSRPGYTLIPDSIFVARAGYADTRAKFDTDLMPWHMRKPVVFWRGSDLALKAPDWRALPRVVLCSAVANNPLFDCGISKLRNNQFPAEVESSGLMRDYIRPTEFDHYQAHIDIDGRSNSWPGLFQKLLSGSPVLKIMSPFRQWYYDRLKPGENYIPVQSDMSDLVEKAEWLFQHPREAEAIGQAGRRLALSMTFEAELEWSVPVIGEAMATS